MLVIVKEFFTVLIDRLKLTQNMHSVDSKDEEIHCPGDFKSVSDSYKFLLVP
jgi:hypothetical protein